jgi:translation elongation factor EF-4
MGSVVECRCMALLVMEVIMDALAEDLNAKLIQWKPETADRVRQTISEIIEMADSDGLDILPSRTVEQDVLDLLDEPTTR